MADNEQPKNVEGNNLDIQKNRLIKTGISKPNPSDNQTVVKKYVDHKDEETRTQVALIMDAQLNSASKEIKEVKENVKKFKEDFLKVADDQFAKSAQYTEKNVANQTETITLNVKSEINTVIDQFEQTLEEKLVFSQEAIQEGAIVESKAYVDAKSNELIGEVAKSKDELKADYLERFAKLAQLVNLMKGSLDEVSPELKEVAAKIAEQTKYLYEHKDMIMQMQIDLGQQESLIELLFDDKAYKVEYNPTKSKLNVYNGKKVERFDFNTDYSALELALEGLRLPQKITGAILKYQIMDKSKNVPVGGKDAIDLLGTITFDNVNYETLIKVTEPKLREKLEQANIPTKGVYLKLNELIVYDSSALNPKAAEMVYTIIHRSGKQ
jgi:hypothetical protein